MELHVISIQKPDAINFILGHSHFIKTVEDIHETLVNAVPGIKFGLAFCEASGPCLIRWSGTDPAMIIWQNRMRWHCLPDTVLSFFWRKVFIH